MFIETKLSNWLGLFAVVIHSIVWILSVAFLCMFPYGLMPGVLIFLPIVCMFSSLFVIYSKKTSSFSFFYFNLGNFLAFFTILVFNWFDLVFVDFLYDANFIAEQHVLFWLESTFWFDRLFYNGLTAIVAFLEYFLVFSFKIDLLGLLFITLNTLVFGLCFLFLVPMNVTTNQNKLFVLLLWLLFALLNMVFLSADILTFFLAFEGSVIPMMMIISLWGSLNKRQANNYFIFYTALGALPMMLAILYVWNQVGATRYLSFHILSLVSWTWAEQMWLWLAFFISFAIKTPMVPVHIWLPKAHVDAPTTGSVILAGILLKVGLFGFLRVLLPIFPLATEFFSPYVAIFSSIGLLYVSLVTLRQIDLKRIVAYSSVAHMNMALVSLCSLNKLGIIASVFMMLSHGIISSAMFFLIGMLYQRFHQRIVTYYGGLATVMPIYTIFLFFFSLANMAFPFTSGFISEFLCLMGITSMNLWLGFLNALSMLCTTLYSILLFSRLCFGLSKHWMLEHLYASVPMEFDNQGLLFWLNTPFSKYDLKIFEVIILSILVAFTLFLGIYPYPLLAILCLH